MFNQRCRTRSSINPFRTAVRLWGRASQISNSLSPKRGCGSEGVKPVFFLFFFSYRSHFSASLKFRAFVSFRRHDGAMLLFVRPRADHVASNHLLPGTTQHLEGLEKVRDAAIHHSDNAKTCTHTSISKSAGIIHNLPP